MNVTPCKLLTEEDVFAISHFNKADEYLAVDTKADGTQFLTKKKQGFFGRISNSIEHVASYINELDPDELRKKAAEDVQFRVNLKFLKTEFTEYSPLTGWNKNAKAAGKKLTTLLEKQKKTTSDELAPSLSKKADSNKLSALPKVDLENLRRRYRQIEIAFEAEDSDEDTIQDVNNLLYELKKTQKSHIKAGLQAREVITDSFVPKEIQHLAKALEIVKGLVADSNRNQE